MHTHTEPPTRITVGELIARFLEACDVRAAFGVISIHNMPILDALHRRNRIRFVSARGEAGACNMADAYARASNSLGVCITSTGTGAGNAAGALVEAITAGTPLLHLTGQIASPYLDRKLGYIHEHPDQLGMLRAVGKAAFRIQDPASTLAVLREAQRIALTPPCGPVSIEIPIDVQKTLIDPPLGLRPLCPAPSPLDDTVIDALAARLLEARRPLLWIGGGARGASQPVARLAAMGFAVISSVQGRGILPEGHSQSLGAYTASPPVETLYQTIDAMLIVGSRLRSNETLDYALQLPPVRYRIDIDPLAENKAYVCNDFIHGDAAATLEALADRLEGKLNIDPTFAAAIQQTHAAAEQLMNTQAGPYCKLKDALSEMHQDIFWVRDVTLSNSIWGNRAPALNHPRSGVHALGGGIGQGVAMSVGAAIANEAFSLGRKTVALCGDGGLMLNLGELACAAQERADVMYLVMNDRGYGVIKNIQDDIYEGRRCYTDLLTPDFSQLCNGLGIPYFHSTSPDTIQTVLTEALTVKGPVFIEVDMLAWGPFAVKFAGPPRRIADTHSAATLDR